MSRRHPRLLPARPEDDVARARQLALDLEAGDPTFEHYTADGSDNLLWTLVFIGIGLVLLAFGAGLLVAQLAFHWRGAIQVGCMAVIGAGFLAGTR